MKNLVIGWLLLIAGGALLGVSLLGMREHAEASQKAGERQERHLEAKAPLAGPERPPMDMPAEPIAAGAMTVDAPAVVPVGADMPADAPADAPVVADMPAEPVASDMPADAPADLKEVLLVFDARSQQISKQVKDELLALGRANPDATFKIEVAAGELSGADENEKLGKRRARAIRRILEDAGIPERRVSYKVQVPGPADGEGEQTSRQWRKATVRIAGGGMQPRSTP